MFCTHCGARNVDGAKFCIQCGTAFTNISAPSSPIKPAFPIESEQEAPIIPDPIVEVEKPVLEDSDATVLVEKFVIEPTVQATIEPTIEPTINPITKPIVEPFAKPITEPSFESKEEKEVTRVFSPIGAASYEAPTHTPEPNYTAPLFNSPAPRPVQRTPEFNSAYIPPRRVPKKKKKTGKIIAIILAVLVLLGGTFAALYFTGVLDGLFKNEEPKPVDISGYYVLESGTINGEALEEEALSWHDYALFLRMDKDGKALFFNGTALIDCTYENGELKPSEGASMAYSVEDDVLTLTTAEGKLIFRLSDKTPDFEALKEFLSTVGYFKLVSMTKNGSTADAVNLGFEHEAFILLNEDGTGILCLNDTLHDMTWGDGLISPIDEQDDPATYTVENDTFTMSKNDIDYTFEHSEESPPDIETLRAELEPTLVGYYTLSQMSLGNTTINITDLEDYYDPETIPFLLINEDGTGILFSSSAMVDFHWDETQFTSDDGDHPLPYEFEDDTIKLDVEGMGMTFTRSDETPPDIDELRKEFEVTQEPSDLDLTGEYEMIAFEMGSKKSETSGVFMTLNADGTGDFSGMSVTWSATGMKVGTVNYTYVINDEGLLVLTGSDGIFYFKSISAPSVQSGGDFYGFWMTTDCTGDMADYDDMWWDICARRTDNGDGTCSITFWDEDYDSIEDPLGVVNFTVAEDGSLKSTNGWFFSADVKETLLSNAIYAVTEDMIVLEGTYSDSKGSYTYTIYLRPWGTKWDDLEEVYWPFYYETWYLPLIEAGESMPNTFDHP